MMAIQDIFFWLFSGIMLASGVMAITSRNPAHAAMWLIQVFLCLAGLYLLLQAFFLAVIQVLVYAGAVMVLFLFVIMLLDLRTMKSTPVSWLAIGGGLLLAAALSYEFFILLRDPAAAPEQAGTSFAGGFADVIKPMFLHYMPAILLTALILLVAMIGIILLSRRTKVEG